MSTRCQIKIEGNKAMIYQHSDGMPGSILPDVLPFLATFHRFRGDDPEYLAARLSQHLMNISDKCLAEMNERMKSMFPTNKVVGPEVLGFGVGTVVHSDIEFLYTVKHDGSVLVEEASHGKGVRRLGQFPLGTNPDVAVQAIKDLGDAK